MLFKRTICDNQGKFFPVFLGCGSFLAASFQNLSSQEKDTLISSVGELIISLAAGVYFIEPERDSDNGPLRSLPPCLTQHFGRMQSAEFVDLTIWFWSRLEKVFTADYRKLRS